MTTHEKTTRFVLRHPWAGAVAGMAFTLSLLLGLAGILGAIIRYARGS